MQQRKKDASEKKREGVQRRTSAKAIVNILIITAFFVAELCNCSENCKCIGVVFFSQRYFFLFLFFFFFFFPPLYYHDCYVFDVFIKITACRDYAFLSINIKKYDNENRIISNYANKHIKNVYSCIFDIGT